MRFVVDIERFADDLDSGAVVVLEDHRIRIRKLPIL
jgi:hypothetical protein